MAMIYELKMCLKRHVISCLSDVYGIGAFMVTLLVYFYLRHLPSQIQKVSRSSQDGNWLRARNNGEVCLRPMMPGRFSAYFGESDR